MIRFISMFVLLSSLLFGEVEQVSHKVYNRLLQANEKIKIGNYSEARDILVETLNSEINKTEKDLTIYFYGNLYLIQKRYALSKMLFKMIASSNHLPKNISKEVGKNLAKLLIQEEQYLEALSYVDVESNEKETLLLLQVIYNQLHHHEASLSVMKKLIKLEPLNIEYWKQTLYLYNRLGQSPKELSVNDIIYKIGGDEVSGELASNLVYLFSDAKIPYQAGKILDRSLNQGLLKSDEKNYKLLTYLYYEAKEYGLMEKSLKIRVKLFDSSEAKAKLSELYIKMSRYREAELLLLSLKNDKEYLGQAFFNLGVVYFYQDRFVKARKEWLKASKFKKFKKRSDEYLLMVKEYL